MKIIPQSVTILSPQTREEGEHGLRLIEYAGRNCYQSHEKITEDSYKSFINNLLRRKHGSPLEFFDITAELTTSRDVMAEITRHRLANFCIESQRYVLESKDGDIRFIAPNFYDGESEASKIWLAAMQDAEASYKEMIAAGAKNEDARKVLPNSTACKIVMKTNVREWLHILDLRTSERAYPEMRCVMFQFLDAVKQVVPFIFDDKEWDKT